HAGTVVADTAVKDDIHRFQQAHTQVVPAIRFQDANVVITASNRFPQQAVDFASRLVPAVDFHASLKFKQLLWTERSRCPEFPAPAPETQNHAPALSARRFPLWRWPRTQRSRPP